MRSPRTEPIGSGRGRGALGRLGRSLTVRLVLSLITVALIGLVVSGLVLNQTLPEYFAEQAQARIQSAAQITADVIRVQAQQFQRNLGNRELRETGFFQPFAEVAANRFAQGTVEIVNVLDESRAAFAMPANEEELRVSGLRPDENVEEVRVRFTITLPSEEERIAPDGVLPLEIRVRDPWTARETTLAQIRGALIVAGFLALVVSLLVGGFAARRLAVPLNRLRRAVRRVAQGELTERVPASGITEIDEVGSQFNLMAERLSETLAALEADRDRLREFVADVSHELRTPIAALRTFIELQRDGVVDEPTRREFLERSSEQISRLEWLSSNLLDLSRIDAGIFPLDVGPGDLRDPVRSVVEAHAETAEQRGLSLASEVPSTPVLLRFDRERIVQLVTNLVGNALKFTPRGGQVQVRLHDAPSEATLEVTDTGPGIGADELPRIFERFYRGTSVGEARASGSGLGLAIARSIAEMHRGWIEVESVVGEGATFRVRLPRRASDERPAEERLGSAAMSGALSGTGRSPSTPRDGLRQDQ